MTHEERLLKTRTAIMRDKRFLALAGIMMDGKCIIIDGLPTAATNGRDVLIGRQFMDTLDDETMRFVVLHEYYHVMYLHMITWKHLFEEDPQLANMAADAVINLQLDDLAGKGADGWLTVWPDAILDPQYRGMDTGEVYRRMKQQAQQQQQKQRSASGGNAQSMDEHRPATGDKPGDVGEALNAAQAKEVMQSVDTAIRQAAIVAGKIGASMNRDVKDLLEVQVDWREVLKDFLRTYAAGGDLSTWRKPSRRGMAQDMYMPSRISETAKRIAIGVDTSGSIGEVQLRRALTEIMGACEIVKPEAVDVVYWDASVAGHETYEDDAVMTIADITKPKGGGGTDPTCMAKYLDARDIKPDCVIQFTDGYVGGNWGTWNAPVLWCISTKGIVAPNGVSLYVPA
jgi:predicted metal-dependent peptidase